MNENSKQGKAGWQHETALKLFDHVESQVRLTDQKAGLIFAADSILLAGYISILNTSLPAGLPPGIKFMILLSSGMATLTILSAILFVLFSIDPVSKLQGYDQHQIFFKLIADPRYNADSKDYENKFLALTEQEITGQLLRSVHGKSQWASGKLTQVNHAVRLTIISVVAAAIGGLALFASRF